MAGFHSISPVGHPLAWGRSKPTACSLEVINGRKMATVCSVNLKAFQVEQGCVSSNEKWGKTLTNPPLKTSIPSLSLLQISYSKRYSGKRLTEADS